MQCEKVSKTFPPLGDKPRWLPRWFLCHRQAFEKHMHEAMRERQEKRHSGKT
jgi:hypothetical protein